MLRPSFGDEAAVAGRPRSRRPAAPGSACRTASKAAAMVGLVRPDALAGGSGHDEDRRASVSPPLP